MVFQSYALYPHLSVRDNLSFGLRRSQARSICPAIHDQAFRPNARLTQTTEGAIPQRRTESKPSHRTPLPRPWNSTELLDRRPKELSGGQKQRVALGRAMARNPEVFLMDEPLSNLDAKLRTSTRQKIVELQRRWEQRRFM